MLVDGVKLVSRWGHIALSSSYDYDRRFLWRIVGRVRLVGVWCLSQEWDETLNLETETRHSNFETRPRWDVCSSRDGIEMSIQAKSHTIRLRSELVTLNGLITANVRHSAIAETDFFFMRPSQFSRKLFLRTRRQCPRPRWDRDIRLLRLRRCLYKSGRRDCPSAWLVIIIVGCGLAGVWCPSCVADGVLWSVDMKVKCSESESRL